jgi:hypothetical protein
MNSLQLLTTQLLTRESAMDEICAHVSDGGTLIDLCKTWGIKYSDAMRFIRADELRNAMYDLAIKDRTEWTKERILDEVRTMATADLTKAFDKEGNMLDPEDWPTDIKRSLVGLEVFEEFQGAGRDREYIGKTKKAKFTDKLKAIEMLGKVVKLWGEKNDSDAVVKLEDLLALSHKLEREQLKSSTVPEQIIVYEKEIPASEGLPGVSNSATLKGVPSTASKIPSKPLIDAEQKETDGK